MAYLIILNEDTERSLRRQRVFRDRSQDLDVLDDRELISRYRFPRRVILQLTDLIRNTTDRPTSRSHAIPAHIQVMATLRFLAKGNYQSETGDIHGISRFININTKFPGPTHDAFILSSSMIPELMQGLPEGGWLLGGSGYPLKTWLLTPVNNPRTPSQTRYNIAHMKTRTVVERAFGILKSRFRVLKELFGFKYVEVAGRLKFC